MGTNSDYVGHGNTYYECKRPKFKLSLYLEWFQHFFCGLELF